MKGLLSEAPIPAIVEAERVVLGAALEDDSLLPEIVESGIVPEDFVTSDHQKIFRAMLSLQGKKCPVDYVSVVEELGGHDGDYRLMGRLVYGVVVNEVLYHVQLVRRMARLRSLLRLAEWITTRVHETRNPDLVVEEVSRKVEECRTK